jgi:AraC-like DNA-binding protein
MPAREHTNLAMAYREQLPHRALRPFVDRYWLRSPEADAAPARILPDGCIDVIYDLAEVPSARAVGTMTRAVIVATRNPSWLVGIRFRPGAAAAFLGTPADALTDLTVALHELGGHWPPVTQTKPIALLAELEHSLLRRVQTLPARDRRLAQAIRALVSESPPAVAELAGALGWTRQHLGRVFRREVGVGPKEFERIVRLQRAVERLESSSELPLARAALELGYFDQAHMARDFRDLAGLTAAEARASAGSIFPIPSLWREA